MARPKILPDTEVLAKVRQLMAEHGDKAVSFSTVSQATGLAGPTLVQRFGSREGMVTAALTAAWDTVEALTDRAEAEAPLNAKGAQAFLKMLGAESETSEITLLAADFRNPALRERAGAWRTRVETALALRLGGGSKAREAAAILFAAWQGQLLWQPAGGKAFRLKDALKRISG